MACVALADGAGSRSRSEIGAEVVVRTTLRLLSAQFDAIYEMCVDAEESARRHIHNRLLESVRRAASRHDCDVRALASTLLFVAHKGHRFLAGHIGDGLIAQIDEGGTPHTLSPPDNGEFANETGVDARPGLRGLGLPGLGLRGFGGGAGGGFSGHVSGSFDRK